MAIIFAGLGASRKPREIDRGQAFLSFETRCSAVSRWFWLLPWVFLPVPKAQPAVSYITVWRTVQGWRPGLGYEELPGSGCQPCLTCFHQYHWSKHPTVFLLAASLVSTFLRGQDDTWPDPGGSWELPLPLTAPHQRHGSSQCLQDIGPWPSFHGELLNQSYH